MVNIFSDSKQYHPMTTKYLCPVGGHFGPFRSLVDNDDHGKWYETYDFLFAFSRTLTISLGLRYINDVIMFGLKNVSATSGAQYGLGNHRMGTSFSMMFNISVL